MAASEGTGHLTTDELFRQHATFVARFLTRLGVPSEQLDDALQEVFLVAHRNGGYRPGVAKPTSYLANIAIRAAAQHRRRQGAALSRYSETPLEQLASEADDPAHALQVRQDLDRLRQALARLPEELCTTLMLVELEGESCVSVAAGLGCPVGTIYWRLHQARKQLQSALRALDFPRRTPQPAHDQGESLQPVRSSMMLFGFEAWDRSEASRLLQRAREQPPPELALDELLVRHQQLVRAGAEVPAWAANCAQQPASWLTLVGAGPITAGVSAGAALAATLLLADPHAPEAPRQVPAQASATAEADRRSEPVLSVGTPAAALDAPSAAAQRSAMPAREAASEPAPGATMKVRRDARAKALADRKGSGAQRGAGAATAATSAALVRLEPTVQSDRAQGPAASASKPADDVAARAPEPQPEPAQRAEPAQAPTADPELAEMREIARAERLLADDPERALALTRTLEAGFPNGRFREERAYLEVMALLELGRTREMHAKAAEFLRAYPAGLYSDRVRKAAASNAN